MLRRDSVLLVRRARAPLAGLWSFPGGRAAPGEDAEATARRELLEETGLTVGTLMKLGSFRPAPDISTLCLTVFAARAATGDPRSGDDALAAEFVPFANVLARPLTAGGARWVARAIAAIADPPLP